MMTTNPPKQNPAFTQKAPTNKTTMGTAEVNLSNISRRLRMLEERYTKATNRMEVDEHAVIDFKKKTNVEIKTIESELDEIKREIAEIKDKILMMIKELRTTARKGDVEVLDKYLQFWDPLNLVTREEFEKRLEEFKEELRKRE
jgi:archaellum component FlaC